MPNPHSTYGDLFDASGIQRRFSASSLKDWQKCPRYYYYTWIEGWHGGAESVHLTFGSHYAAVLQKFYLLRSQNVERDDAIRQCVRALLEWTWDEETGPWDPEEQGLSKSNLKNRWTLIRTFVWYIDEWKEDIPIWTLSNNTPAVELKVEVDIGNGNSFVGTLDRVGKIEGELLVMDQKTTGTTLSGYWFEGFDLDTQMSMYPFLARVGLNAAVSGVLIDGAQIAVGFSRFARQPTYRTESQLGEWFEETESHIHAIQSANASLKAVGELAYPRNFSGCSLYGRCVFYDICRKPREVRPNFLRANFTKESRS